MPDLSSPFGGSLFSASGFTSQSLTFTLCSQNSIPRILILKSWVLRRFDSFCYEKFVHHFSEGADMIGRTAATRADDICFRIKQRLQTLDHLLRRLVVQNLHVPQPRLSAI